MTTEYYLVSINRGENVELMPIKCSIVRVIDGFTYFSTGDKDELAISPRTDFYYMELTAEQYDDTVEKLEQQEATPEPETEGGGSFQEQLSQQNVTWR